MHLNRAENHLAGRSAIVHSHHCTTKWLGVRHRELHNPRHFSQFVVQSPIYKREHVMSENLRLAEFLAALSLATDLGMGQPLEQALRTCLIALSLGDRLGLGPDDLSDVYYVALLRFLGCTADAHEFAELVGGDDIGEIGRASCRERV